MARSRLPKSMTGIFHDLQRNRQDAATARAAFVVVSLKKDGSPRQPDASDLRYSTTQTLEQAEARKADMERLNPGKQFTIITRERR